MHDPWSRLALHPEVKLRWADMDGTLGYYDHSTSTIVLATGMTQAEQRCTLAHELVHYERGPVSPDDLIGWAREEAAVDELAARNLIALEDLADVITWASGIDEAAEQLAVDVATLRNRLERLSADELAVINRRRAACEQVA